MSFALNSMPVVWPSLSDLAQLLGVKLSTLSRLPDVRRRPTRRIGREVKVPPSDAVAILVERGLSAESATTAVLGVIQRRSERVPALLAPTQPLVEAPAEARLERSGFRPTNDARLERSNTPYARRSVQPAAPSRARYEAIDRRFGYRIIPLERYIYDDKR